MRRSWWMRAGVALLLLGGAAGGLHWHVLQRLPAGEALAAGVTVDGLRGDGVVTAAALVKQAAAARLDRRLELRLDGEALWAGTPRALGARVDQQALAEEMAQVGRRGDVWQRYDEALQARGGELVASLPVRLPATVLAPLLAERKHGYDRAPRAARWDFDKQVASDHQLGRSIDVYATVEAVLQAIRRGEASAEVVVVHTPPRATREVVTALDRSQLVSEYRTRYGYVGNQRGRAQNVARAAAGINGLVMMPGEAVSFNGLVGPRSVSNGFAEAGEIYKGELRMGIGGGTCQVASTFHAAAYLGGLEVVERSPHSRPSGYIGVGLDATVAYPHVDLQLKNPFPFPVVVRARAVKGEMYVALYGEQQPVTVDFRATTVGIKKYKRKVRTGHWLTEGKVYRKQKGRRGMTIEKVRRIQYTDGRTRVETTRDEYPPTNEVYYVAPGTDAETSLPPLPEDVAG